MQAVYYRFHREGKQDEQHVFMAFTVNYRVV